MNTRTTPSPLSADAAELVRRLGMILAGLAALVAARFLRNPRLVGLIGPMWRRLTHVAGRVERALARPKRTLTARARRATRARAQHVQVPQGRGWLVRELGYEAVGFGLQLQHLLTEPAMQAALATMPAAGLVLRPVCRMLGVVQPLARAEVAALQEPLQSMEQSAGVPILGSQVAPDSVPSQAFSAQPPPSRPAAATDPPQRAR